MKSFISRCRIRLSDHLLFSPLARGIARKIKLYKNRVSKSSSTEDCIKCINALCSCIRLAKDDKQIIEIEKRIEQVIDHLKLHECDAKLLDPDGDVQQIQKAIFLKPWNEATGEKGVIFISFEYQWVRLLSLSATDLKRFAEQYTLVVSPTWTPPHSVVNYLFPRLFPAPIYCLISNVSDMDTFPRMSDNYHMVRLFASNWVDHKLFQPRSKSERDIDIFMLANFGTYKRHHVLFRALRNMPDTLKVTLIGQPNGKRTAAVLLAEAEAFGVKDRIQLLERVSDEKVVDTLCRSKVSLIFSRREGSCVAVVEAFFADTPVGLVQDAQIGSATFINPETGRFLNEKHMVDDLTKFLAESDGMEPRKWAMDNGISAQTSCVKLNEILKKDALDAGDPWENDIADFHWRPNPLPLNPEDKIWQTKECQRVEDEFNLEIGASKK